MVNPTEEGAENTSYLIPNPDLLAFLLNMDKAVYTDSIGQIACSSYIIKAGCQLSDFTVYTVILLGKPNNITMIMPMKDKELLQGI